MASENRYNVTLDPESIALAEAIGEAIGASAGERRSPALRYALRIAAKKLGITVPKPTPEKKQPRKA